MSGVIGTSGGGYATVNPTQGNPLGEALTIVENSAFKYNALRQEKAKAKQDQRNAEFDDGVKFRKENPFVATGTGIDASNRQSYTNAADAASDAKVQYAKTGDPKWMAVYHNAVMSANHISEMPTQLNSLMADLEKNKDSYNPESLKRVQDRIAGLSNGNIVQQNDENGNPKYTIFEKDDNNQLTKIVKKDLNGTQLKDYLKAVPNFNIEGKDGLIDRFSKNVGKETTVVEGSGLNQTKRTFTPGADEFAKIVADNAISDHSGMYETLIRLGLDPENKDNYTDPKVKEKASQYLQNILLTTRKESTSKDPNYDGLNYDLNLKSKNETARHNRVIESKDNTPVSLGTEPTKLQNKSIDGVKMPNDTYSYPLDGMMIGKDGKGITATNIFVSPTGKMTLRLEEVGYEGDSRKRTFLTKEAQAKKAKDPKYVPAYEDYEDVTTTDRKPKGRILDFGKDGSEISKYAKKAGLTVGQLQRKYMDLYEQQTGTKLPKPKTATSKPAPKPAPKPTAKPKSKVYVGIDPATGKAIYK